MNVFKSRIVDIGIEQVRGNTNYSSGVAVRTSSVGQAFLESPWVKSTLSINAYDRQDWTNPQVTKEGISVVYRSPEGASFRTVVNPKITCGGIATDTGKTSSLSSSTSSNQITEAELIFPGGKTIAPTVIALRSTTSTTSVIGGDSNTTPAPLTGDIGQIEPMDPGAISTFMNTSNTTGTYKMTDSFVKNLELNLGPIVPQLKQSLGSYLGAIKL